MNEETAQCRKQLQQAIKDCVKALEAMTEQGHSAPEKRGQAGLRPQSQKDASSGAECQGSVGAEIRKVIAEARRLSRKAEEGMDLRTALQGQDLILKALKQLELCKRMGEDDLIPPPGCNLLPPAIGGMAPGDRKQGWSEEMRRLLAASDNFTPAARMAILDGWEAASRAVQLRRQLDAEERASELAEKK